MRFRYGCLAFFAIAFFAAAQNKPATQSPDREAYKQAVRRMDARERVNWLRKFLRDYPKSSRVDGANELILKTLVENWPDRTEEIRDQVGLMTRRVHGNENEKADKLDTIADILVTHGVLLETAEKLELQALNYFHEKRYLAKLKHEYAEAKVPISAAELQRESDEEHASLLTTMGRVYLARGSTGTGQNLLEQAHKLDPADSAAAAVLGEIALHAGRDSEALELLMSAQLLGKLIPEQRKDLQDLYQKLHPDSPGGLDAWLDQMYRQKFPASFHVVPYEVPDQAPAERGKTVLAELFTGAGCPPCVGFDVAMDAAMERYSKRDVAVLMYHEHVPEPDPMANPSTVKRFSFYDVRGTPTLAIDGETMLGGGNREAARSIYEKIFPKIDEKLKTSPDLSLALSASREGERITARASLDPGSHGSKNMRLQIVLAEKQVRYSGENGIRFHPMVVRAMAGGDGDGFAIDPSGAKVYDATFDVSQIGADLKSYLDSYEMENDRFGPIHFSEKKYLIDVNNIAIIAFVQDVDTKRVLQATYREPDALRSSVH
jgi:tetratricopeptide (TPR) repeat protein